MTIGNDIELHGRLTAVAGRAALGIALAISWYSLIADDALAGTSLSANSQQSAPQLQTGPSQSLKTFGLAQPNPQPLAIRDAKLKHPNHRLRIHNLCSKTVEIVVRYQDSQRSWLMQAGGRIPGKTSRYLTSSTSQPLGVSQKVLYYYATSPDSELVWSGSGSHQYYFEGQILNMRIHYSALDILDDYSLFILCAAETP